MFDPNRDSILLAFKDKTPEEELGIISEFYDAEPVKLTRVTSDGQDRATQLFQKHITHSKMVEAFVRNRVMDIIIVNEGIATLAEITNEGPKYIKLGNFKKVGNNTVDFCIVCNESDTSWIIEGIEGY